MGAGISVDKGCSCAREEGGEGFAVLLADVEEVGAADGGRFWRHHGPFRLFDGVRVGESVYGALRESLIHPLEARLGYGAREFADLAVVVHYAA